MSIYVTDADGNRKKVAGTGSPGPAGKSAYQYAAEGGFSGTEDEFKALMGVRSNINLLHNWYFPDPVNQKGQTEYTDAGSGSYCIDRWVIIGPTKLQIVDGGVILSSTGSGHSQIQQTFVEDYREFAGQIITISVLTMDGELYSASGAVPLSVSAAYTWVAGVQIPGKYEFIAVISSHNKWLYLSFNNPAASGVETLGIVAAKVDIGPVQTLAHKEGDAWVLNDPPPDKALELLKCRRYMFAIENTSGANPGVGWGVVNDSSTIAIDIPVPISMRIAPAVKMSGGWFLLGLGLSFEAESRTIHTRG